VNEIVKNTDDLFEFTTNSTQAKLKSCVKDLPKRLSLLFFCPYAGRNLHLMCISRYSWPNVVLCFFGGYLLDRVFGIRLGSILFCLLILVGQLIFALGNIAAAQHVEMN